jgi:hypothetical protein
MPNNRTDWAERHEVETPLPLSRGTRRTDVDGGVIAAEAPSAISSIVTEVTRLRSYLRTRSLVIAGEPLFDWSSQTLQDQKLIDPWTFNAFQTTLSGMPGLAVAWVVDVWAGAPARTHVTASGRIAVKVAQSVQPFLLPLSLFLAASLLSWASLRSKDRTPVARQRARRAYLYFDGAYGVAAEAFVPLSVVVMPNVGEWLVDRLGGALSRGLMGPTILGEFAAVGWLLTIMLGVIPNRLFVTNGYSLNRRSDNDDVRTAPRLQYNVMKLVAVPCLLYLPVIILAAMSGAIGVAIAWASGAV